MWRKKRRMEEHGGGGRGEAGGSSLTERIGRVIICIDKTFMDPHLQHPEELLVDLVPIHPQELLVPQPLQVLLVT